MDSMREVFNCLRILKNLAEASSAVEQDLLPTGTPLVADGPVPPACFRFNGELFALACSPLQYRLLKALWVSGGAIESRYLLQAIWPRRSPERAGRRLHGHLQALNEHLGQIGLACISQDGRIVLGDA